MFRDCAPYKGEWKVQDFLWEHLAKDDVRIDPTTKQVAGEAVTWMVRVSSHLSDAERDGEPGEGAAEAVSEGGREGRSPSPVAPACRDERGGLRSSRGDETALPSGNTPTSTGRVVAAAREIERRPWAPSSRPRAPKEDKCPKTDLASLL